MNILAINTAFSESYVALKRGEEEILKQMDSSLKQSENLLGLIDQTLNQANISCDKLDKVACVIGPGSFTGIRIGVGVAKGICFNKNISRCEINSLDLLAYTYAKQNIDNDFWVVLNALSGNLFARKYDKIGKFLSECKLLDGTGLEFLTGDIVGLEEEQLEICNKYVNFSSKDLLEFSDNLEKSTDFTPLYLRKSQAEAELDKKNANN